ncbi:MAG: NADP-dependent malic enzyme [Chloroflexi bacterium]|nr:NADP-dependent malic enzyme [Chloroflexota bacterium]
MTITKEEALRYHREPRPGKLEIRPTKPMATQRDLSLAYTPGVAVPVLEIDKDPETAFEYTAKGNLVAVLSNGTAILGLGNRGALASKPVMEGKAVLFKRFADVDVFDIEVDTQDADEVIRVAELIAPTFGGINLEDIKAPECFYVEETLIERLDIPVFHDDQHGTAIIAAAGLLNALELQGKKIDEIKVVINGAGASGIATAQHLVNLGVPKENIILCDSRGVIYKGRKERMNPYKERFAADTDARTLAEALKGADVFIGLSVANVVTPEMVKSMADKPIIFALANPDPEIPYEAAKEARPDAIVATGRSDYPNQVNNVLGFPFIFRGALDVRARKINEAMKIAATKALAALAKEDVPDSVLSAYGLKSLHFGPEYIIPKPLDPRVMLWVSPAVAKAAMETGVARRHIDIEEYKRELEKRLGKGWEVMRIIIDKARQHPKRVVFGEGEEERIIRAAHQVYQEGLAKPILLGRPDVIRAKVEELGIPCQAEIVEPASYPKFEEYVQALYERRQRKGVTLHLAHQLMRLPTYFGPMMVAQGDADAYVCGLTYNYPDVIRPALQIVGTRPGVAHVSGAYVMLVKNRVYVFSDATVNLEPDAEALAEIAIHAADLARYFNIEPRVAMLSFSNFGSVKHPEAEKVQRAVELVRERRPDLLVDGEMQADVAVVPELIEAHYPFSRVKDANVLIFPDLDSANVAYKLLQRLGDAEAIGPILLGMGAPIQVLSTGATVREITHMTAIAVLSAQEREEM